MREADRLDHFVDNLLDMSCIEGGALKPKKVLYVIDALILETIDYMQPLLCGRSIELDVPDLPPVELDPIRIGQVLSNLIENAVHYTPTESSIEIHARTNGEQMLISIADRGPGIKANDIERIFEKFYRSHPTYPPGSGLGLAVCRGLVEAHNGRIWAENRDCGGA
ncbi:MAG: two-component system sensor histidine kinase KdbD, partial [Chloroflexi bacterium]